VPPTPSAALLLHRGAMQPADSALLRLGQTLAADGYHFVTVTPETHRRVLLRPPPKLSTLPPQQRLRAIFGWSQPFAQNDVPAALWTLMEAADVLKPCPQQAADLLTTHQHQATGLAQPYLPQTDQWRSTVRFSSLGADLYVHSSYPTHADQAVFFGPDTYRFANLLQARAPKAQRCLDVGCGSGAGALSIAPRLQHITLSDVNVTALRFAQVNAALAQRSVTLRESDLYAAAPGPFDLIVANPPYLVDAQSRAYRHGGGKHGIDLAVRIVVEGLARLSPVGELIVYTGTPICAGTDTFYTAIQAALQGQPVQYEYGEIDPDVFGEEIERPCYAEADRLAAVYLHIKPR
jgi:methylase of polypeptide subunit release factors